MLSPFLTNTKNCYLLNSALNTSLNTTPQVCWFLFHIHWQLTRFTGHRYIYKSQTLRSQIIHFLTGIIWSLTEPPKTCKDKQLAKFQVCQFYLYLTLICPLIYLIYTHFIKHQSNLLRAGSYSTLDDNLCRRSGAKSLHYLRLNKTRQSKH